MPGSRRFVPFLAVLFFGLSSTSRSQTTVTITEAAATRALVATYFAPDGRYDLLEHSKCSFAYLRSPLVSFDKGDVVVKAHFTSRQALEVRGECVGRGDDLDVVARARVRASEGGILLDNLRVSDGGGSPLAEMVVDGFAKMLPASQRVEVRDLLKSFESAAAGGYRFRMDAFVLSSLNADQGKLVLKGALDASIE